MLTSQTPFDLDHRLPKTKEIPKSTVRDSSEEGQVLISDTSGLEGGDIESPSRKGNQEKAILPENMQKEQKKPLPLSQQRKQNLIFGTFILLVLYLTVVISFRRSVVNEIFRSILNDNYANLLLRKLRSRGLSQFVFLYFFSVINGGLFLFLVSEQTNMFDLGVNLLTISAIIGGIYLLRHFVLYLVAGIFPLEKPINQFSFTILIFNLFLGLILFPINLFIAFSPDIFTIYSIYFALAIIGLFYFLRQLRGLFIASPLVSQNKFHFLLYLCTIEIAPLAVLYKFFHPYFS
ncbi:MAG: DUF4271 domain-containing protein [Bacteroidetes bacterium]|nr:DUF4271 domain-containing protein [Bacteroidota bacterium]